MLDKLLERLLDKLLDKKKNEDCKIRKIDKIISVDRP